ncbi:Ig domain protein group 1 domain protein [Tatumella sp. JGM16]|nr:Ig domain protein group 1 domain protein [Tatumella sp. JGM16]MBS0914001.1 Ig domain protein group 1 domain protein [Tatumella sp. JGM91]
MSDQSVAQPEAAQPAAAQPVAAESAQPADTGSLNSGSGAQVADTTSTSSPLEQAKAKFDAFVEFVEHGLEVLGEDAEADLVALKDKFL